MQPDNLIKQFDHPVIIIAAARSGTKMLREVLAQSMVFAEFSYDMNYIWLYGNYQKKHDELTTADLTPEIKNFVRKRFEKLLRKNETAERVLEKSVPNSLRVEFVREIFPDAQFIHLYRNGLDVSADAMQCWQSSLFSQRIQKKSDLVKKIISYPYLSAYPYLKDYLSNYIARLFSKDKSVPLWGPRYRNIDEDIKRLSLIEICGIQWSRSVTCSIRHFSSMQENDKVINVKYEDLVRNPKEEIGRICNFVNIPDADAIVQYAQETITSDFIDFYKGILSEEDKKVLMPHIQSSLKDLGYLEE